MSSPRNFRKRVDAPWLGGWALVLLVTGLSGAMSVSFALARAAETGLTALWLLAALVSQGAILLVWPLTFGRGRWAAGALGTIALLPCLLFSWGAAYDVARANFAATEAARGVSAAQYDAQRARVARLKAQLDDVAGAPALDKARADVPRHIWTRTGECTDVTVPESRAACSDYLDARTRAGIEADLASAFAALDKMKPESAAQTDGGPALALAQMISLPVESWGELMGWVMAAMSEIGALVLPLMVALAGGAQPPIRERALKVWAQTHGDAAPEFLPGPVASAARLGSGPETPKIRDARDWVGECIEAAPGEWAPYATLHKAYSAWARENGREQIAYNHLGSILSEQLGLEKYKSGKVSYIGIRLKAGAPARRGEKQTEAA